MQAPIRLTTQQLLELIPQQPPFRFVDEITEVDELRISGHYRFRETESFYSGHFPNNPVTPGVILLESMCQIGVVALGIYILNLEESPEEVSRWTTLLADTQVEFMRLVRPGEKVTVHGEKIFWRRKKLRCALRMIAEDGATVACGTASGIGVRNG